MSTTYDDRSWEYMTVTHKKATVPRLNEFGRMGWEVVTTVRVGPEHWQTTFKRKIKAA